MPEKILIVDDSSVNRKLLVGILKKEGHDFIEAVDGEEAVELARREMLDLILLDVVMPNKDGYETCSELKDDDCTCQIPILFLSTLAETEKKIKGLDVGGSDYVTKPFDRGEVMARVRAQLKIRSLTRELIRANEELLRTQKSLDDNLKAGAEIQKSLLPKTALDTEVMDVAWRFMPCGRMGGDIFNIFRLDENHWAIYMLDVSGHGVPAAMVAVTASQLLQPGTGYLPKRFQDPPPHYQIAPPADVLNELNREFPVDRFEKYITMSYLVLNTKNGTLRYSTAAHPPPLLLQRDGTLKLLEEGGTIIGREGMLTFNGGEKQLCFGDKLFLYTDGIVEYQDKCGEFYGEDRFYIELQRLRNEPISKMIDGVIDSMTSFGNNTEPQDDISLLGLEFRGQGG